MAAMTNPEAMQPYQRIVQDLRRQIATGQLQPGSRIPGIKELAEQYAVAPGTAQRALGELRIEGLIYSQQGRGSFVSVQAPISAESTADAVRRLEGMISELLARVEKLERGSD